MQLLGHLAPVEILLTFEKATDKVLLKQRPCQPRKKYDAFET